MSYVHGSGHKDTKLFHGLDFRKYVTNVVEKLLMQGRTVHFAPTPISSPDSDFSCSCDSNSSCRLRRRQRKRHSAPVLSSAKVMPSILRSSSARMPGRNAKRKRPSVLSLKDMCVDALIQNVIHSNVQLAVQL